LKKYLYQITLLAALVAYPAGVYFHSNFEQYIDQQRTQFIEQEKYCLKEALWFEARGESEQGIRAVANVIINRKISSRYPSTYCGVIWQYKQFSYTIPGYKGKPLWITPKTTEYTALQQIDEIVQEVFDGRFRSVLPQSVLWYHTTSVNPKWSRKKKTVRIVGRHVFKH
jgi:spore germination cell wall hydrolase CwlJ-like protein